MTPVLDAHVHLWDRGRHPQPWIDPVTMAAIDRDFHVADLGAMLVATAIDAAVLVQATNDIGETADLLALAVDAPVAAVVGWVDVTGDVPGQVDQLRAGPGGSLLRGVRHLAHLEADPEWLLRPEVAAGIDALAAADLSFDLIVRAEQLPTALRAVREHPGTRFVLDHLGNPPFGDLAGWGRDLRALAAEPNLVAKVSGLVMGVPQPSSVARVVAAVDAALDAFGAERLMYGSDWPLAELAHGGAASWAGALSAIADRVSPAERAALFGGTCASTYAIAA